jgi:hypothetical protein
MSLLRCRRVTILEIRKVAGLTAAVLLFVLAKLVECVRDLHIQVFQFRMVSPESIALFLLHPL